MATGVNVQVTFVLMFHFSTISEGSQSSNIAFFAIILHVSKLLNISSLSSFALCIKCKTSVHELMEKSVGCMLLVFSHFLVWRTISPSNRIYILLIIHFSIDWLRKLNIISWHRKLHFQTDTCNNRN